MNYSNIEMTNIKIDYCTNTELQKKKKSFYNKNLIEIDYLDDDYYYNCYCIYFSYSAD